jgi:hypothetical protein
MIPDHKVTDMDRAGHIFLRDAVRTVVRQKMPLTSVLSKGVSFR